MTLLTMCSSQRTVTQYVLYFAVNCAVGTRSFTVPAAAACAGAHSYWRHMTAAPLTGIVQVASCSIMCRTMCKIMCRSVQLHCYRCFWSYHILHFTMHAVSMPHLQRATQQSHTVAVQETVERLLSQVLHALHCMSTYDLASTCMLE